MKHLNEYANDFLSNDTPFAFESYYDSVFKKVDIYNKNTRLINEGKYNSLPTHIPYSTYEQAAISEMLFGLQFKYLYNALSDVCQLEINEGISDIADKMKEALSKGKEAFTNYIKELVDKIPSNVKEAYDKLAEIAERGISNVKEFLNKILKVFKLIGDNLNEVLDKLGLFKDEVLSEIPENTEQNDLLSKLIPEDDKKKKLINFIISQTHEGVKNKSVVRDFSIKDDDDTEVSEGLGKKLATGAVVVGGLTGGLGGVLLVLGTIVGSVLLYKGTVGLGKFLSNKLEPYLLSDKVKSSIEKMYNNKILRYGLGLKVSDQTNEEMSKFKKFLKMIHSIIINIIIASAITLVLTISLKFLLGGIIGTTTITIIVAALVAAKNIFTTIANRILNFKKETITKDGKKINNYFFDFLTMFSIFSSIFTFLWKIEAVREWFKSIFNKLIDAIADSTPTAAAATNEIERYTQLGIFDEDGKFHKFADKPMALPGEKVHEIPILNPADGKYYLVGNDGIPELVPMKQLIKNEAFIATEIGGFTHNAVGRSALKDALGWSGTYVESMSRSSTESLTKTIQDELGTKVASQFSDNFQSVIKTVQCLTTESGETFISVFFSRNAQTISKACFGTEELKYVGGVVQHVFNIDELGGNFKELIGEVVAGQSYDSYSELLKNEDFINNAITYAVKHGDVVKEIINL